MKTFKICKKTNEVVSKKPLKSFEMFLSGGDVCIITSQEEAVGLIEGGKLHFEKTAVGNDGRMIKVCETDVKIKKLVDSENGEKKEIYVEYIYINPMTVTSFNTITNDPDVEDPFNFKFYFTSDTLMVRGDIQKYERYMGEEYRLYIKKSNGNYFYFTGLDFCYPYELVRGLDIVDSGNNDCCSKIERFFNYETMERNSLLAKTRNGNEEEPVLGGDTAIFATNPYYFSYPTGEEVDPIVLYDNVVIEKYTDFTNLGLVFEQDYDAKKMFQEYQVNELFVNRIKNSLIPDFIDLEKIKYAPAFLEGNGTGDTATTFFLATGLTFNLHFRTRDMIQNPDPNKPSDKYKFEDVWHLNDATDTWNGNSFDTKINFDDLYSDEEFVNSSNLMGFLGFTDEDVYNQKNRVKQTFIRLLFYDGENPLTQNLLYYSTIFLDSGELFGKFVKRKMQLMEADEKYNEDANPVVWSGEEPLVSAVTSQITVNDEYDMTKSGEGFNVYLFREDAPIEVYNPTDPENTSQDIYMKVEFNHAGIGRTVPLIYWPKDTGGTPTTLTIENYLKNLYIKVRISLTDRGYVYYFPDAVMVENKEDRCNGILWENDRLVFNLFEPMITPDDFENEEQG